MTVQPDLCRTCSENNFVGFLTRRLIMSRSLSQGTWLRRVPGPHTNMHMPTFTANYSTLYTLEHISIASFIWDIGKQSSPRYDTAECSSVQSRAILFAQRNFFKKFRIISNHKIKRGLCQMITT